MENIATELGVPEEVLLRGLPQRLRHASDGVILRRLARLSCRADYLYIRDPDRSVDVLRPMEATPVVRVHVMPYMALKDAADIYIAMGEEGGGADPHHRQVIVMNQDVLLAKFIAYRSIVEQADLLDSLSESVENLLTVRLQAQLQSYVADQMTALANLKDYAWRLVLHYLREGDILEAKKYLGACFPAISQMIDDNPAIAHGAYEYLLASLEEKFDGEGHDLSSDIRHYLACLASFRLMHLKAENLRFIITVVELFVADMTTKREGDFLHLSTSDPAMWSYKDHLFWCGNLCHIFPE